ncbi:hypothetical protein [Endothiovibrio diazotrophicus]
MKRFLVIGATGVAGSAGIEAIRQHYGTEAHVTALWYGRGERDQLVEGADLTLYGDISDPACLDQIAAQAGEQFDWCLYATALGDVGFPSDEASAEQIADSNRLSFDPLPVLEERFAIGTFIGYSTFYNLAHQKITYGAMAHSKRAIEEWTLAEGKSRRVCLRAGAFRSASSQGIKLLVRRRAKELAASTNPLLRSFFENQKPSVAVERLERAVFEEERATYEDTGTDKSSLITAHLKIFAGEGPFVNVCGRHIWTSKEALPL